MKKIFFGFIFIYIFSFIFFSNAFADFIESPCDGKNALLSLIDRPTISYSACVVPFKSGLLEMGVQYQTLMHSEGKQQNLPEAELRIGLPADTEFDVFFPNYIHQSLKPYSGNSSTTLGVKHQFAYASNWVTAANLLITQPNGSATFGNDKFGTAINSMTSYNVTQEFNISVMLGINSTSDPSSQGGRRFTTVNPDIVFTYAVTPIVNFYAEFYGQTKTSSTDGCASVFDGGIIYLPWPILEVDLEVGQRISGSLGNFNHYIGTGLSIWF